MSLDWGSHFLVAGLESLRRHGSWFVVSPCPIKDKAPGLYHQLIFRLLQALVDLNAGIMCCFLRLSFSAFWRLALYSLKSVSRSCFSKILSISAFKRDISEAENRLEVIPADMKGTRWRLWQWRLAVGLPEKQLGRWELNIVGIIRCKMWCSAWPSTPSADKKPHNQRDCVWMGKETFREWKCIFLTNSLPAKRKIRVVRVMLYKNSLCAQKVHALGGKYSTSRKIQKEKGLRFIPVHML